MSARLGGAVSSGTVGRSTVGPAVPAGSTFTPWFATSAIFWPERVSRLALAPEDAQVPSRRSPPPGCCRRCRGPPSCAAVGVEIVVLPARAAVWKLASPDWTASAVRCCRETGFCELSTIVIRVSGRTLICIPSAKTDLGGGTGAGAHEVVLLEHHRESRRLPLERARALDVDAAVDRGEAGTELDTRRRAAAGGGALGPNRNHASAPSERRAPRRRARGSCS